MPLIRLEATNDISAIRAVNEAAFGRPGEADLVDRLRAAGRLLVSLVAVEGDVVVGHIAFSPVRLADADEQPLGVGLGPMAVLPAYQNRAIGSVLVQAGLDACRDLGAAYAVVLGHPAYYPRFGFVPASRFGLRCQWPVPDDVFMAQELQPQGLAAQGGLVAYDPAFDAV